MCGRYALWIRSREVRQSLEDSNMPSQTEPGDDEYRHTYNFAPGYYGLVYRADVPDYGAGGRPQNEQSEADEQTSDRPGDQEQETVSKEKQTEEKEPEEQKYKLQSMKWGLVPFWTKRNPDYGTLMRTINCRDDSLAQGGGMWASMKKRKRCIVVAQGFYEWLKKNNGKERIPHFIKRKDEKLLCFAGLWDCVQFEGSEEKLYTYTIITTDPNQDMKFLHDRMPVVLDPGSEEMFRWLDGNKSEYTKDLQDVLKPFPGELEIYPVTKEVGKVGNDSPSFIVPLNSSENKQNIANFFSNKQKPSSTAPSKISSDSPKSSQDTDSAKSNASSMKSSHDKNPNAVTGIKRSQESLKDEHEYPSSKAIKLESSPTKSPVKSPTKLPAKNTLATNKKTRSATSNGSAARPVKPQARDGSRKITSFFGK